MTPTPDTKAGWATEKIMIAFSRFSGKAILPVEDTPTYNKLYSHVLNILTDEFKK